MLIERAPTPDQPGADAARLTLNELVLRYPQALPVLHRHGMDTCCGGGLTLEEACRRHGVAADEVLREVGAAEGR